MSTEVLEEANLAYRAHHTVTTEKHSNLAVLCRILSENGPRQPPALPGLFTTASAGARDRAQGPGPKVKPTKEERNPEGCRLSKVINQEA